MTYNASDAELDDAFEPLVRPILPRGVLEFLHGDPNTPKGSPILRYKPDEPTNAEWVEKDEVQRALAFHSLAAFVDYMWPVIHPGRPFKRGPHVDVMCFALEQLAYGRIENNELVLSVPPRMLKSVTVNIMFPAWIWLHSPGRVVMGISSSDDVAKRDNRRMRSLITSDQYKRLLQTGVQIQREAGIGLAQEWELTKDQNEKHRFENTLGGQRFALAAGAKITGEGMDLQIVDDPVDAKEAMEGTGEQMLTHMNKSVARYNGVWSTRMQDPGRSARVVIMQRLHEADLAGCLLASGAASIILPMEYDPNHPNLCPFDWRTEEGQLLLPAHYPPFHLARMKSADKGLGAYGYAAQFQQSPSPVGGGRFELDRWSYYSAPPTQQARYILEHGGHIVGSFDCASKTGFSNAYSVGLVVGFLDRTVFVLDMYRDRVELPGLIDMYDRMQSEWAGLIGEYLIEDASNGTALLQMRAGTPIHPQHHGGKETRAGYTETHQRQGNVMLTEMGGWHEWLKKEHALFPNGTFADTVDALAQAILYYTINILVKPKASNKNDEFGWLQDLMNSDPQLRDLMF